MNVPVEYRQLRDAILSSDQYYGLADDLRSACRRFVSLDGEADKTAYEAAVKEVLDLMAAKKLTPSPAHPFPDIHGSQVPRETDAASPPVEADIPKHIGFSIDGLMRVRVADLKPNPINATVFSSSLGLESIRELAEDIGGRRLQNPIQVTPGLLTADGERRRLALQLLGEEETYVRVVHGIDTPEDVESYIWDSYSSARDAALDERVKLYQLAVKVLQRRHGKPKGRPSKKSPSNDGLFWDHDRVRKEAAKRAGFGSEVIADRAVSVFERADADLLAKLVAGEVTISAAYARLSKPKADKRKGSEGEGTKTTAKKADTEETETKATDPSTTAHADEDQTEQTQADDKAKDKPTTQAQQTEAAEQPTTTTATSTTAASADQQQDETTATTRPEQEQADTNAKADTDAARPAIKFKDALSVVMRVIAKNGPKLGRGVMTQIGSQEAITYWLRSPKPREDLSALDDHVADRLETLANKDLDDAKSWLEEHDKRLWAIIRERVPRQEGDDRADNSDYE